MTRFIEVPLVTVNDDTALLSVWTKAAGNLVHKGELVAVIETTKATLDLEAEDTGYLHIFSPQGVQVAVGAVIGAICDSPDEKPQKPASGDEVVTAGGPERKLTKKAEIAANKAGLDLNKVRAEVPGSAPIVEADIAAYVALHGASMVAAGKDTVDDAYPQHRQQRLLIIGGGLGAVQVLDSLCRIDHQRATVIVDDDPSLQGKTVMGVPILGGQRDIESLFKQGLFDAGLVSVSTSIPFRERMWKLLGQLNIPAANVIDPTAQIRKNAVIGAGNVILANCHIGSCTIIGNGCFFSPYIDIEHHCAVGDFCSFGPGVMTSSLVRIGTRVKFGTGIFVEPKLVIGDDSIIGSGAILTRNIAANSIVKTKVNYTVRPRD